MWKLKPLQFLVTLTLLQSCLYLDAVATWLFYFWQINQVYSIQFSSVQFNEALCLDRPLDQPNLLEHYQLCGLRLAGRNHVVARCQSAPPLFQGQFSSFKHWSVWQEGRVIVKEERHILRGPWWRWSFAVASVWSRHEQTIARCLHVASRNFQSDLPNLPTYL